MFYFSGHRCCGKQHSEFTEHREDSLEMETNRGCFAFRALYEVSHVQLYCPAGHAVSLFFCTLIVVRTYVDANWSPRQCLRLGEGRNKIFSSAAKT